MYIKLIFLFCWIAFSLLEATNDAHYYFDRMNSVNPDKENIHWIYFIQRLLYGGVIAFAYSLVFSLLSTAIFSAGLILIFSFFHNGQYYVIRHKLNSSTYQDGWWSNSNSSEAFIEFSDVTRTILAIIGFGAILITMFDTNI